MNTPLQFGHEKLLVYQKAIEFVAWADQILERVPKKWSVHDQLDRASTSIPLNIAEGNGKWHAPDRCRFFDIAWGSALESAAALDVIVAKRGVDAEAVWAGKLNLGEIVRMIVGLIKANDPQRTFGENPEVDTSIGDEDQGQDKDED